MSGLLMHPPSCGQHTQSGFSLIELVVVIIIIGVMVAAVAPNITNSMDRQRNKQATEMLKSAFREARTESQLRRQDVEVRLDGNALTLVALGESTPLRQFSSHQKISITATSKVVRFKSNKSVIDPSKASANTFSYNIVCDKDSKKQGSKVVLDNNGNVKVDDGASQC